MQNNPQHNDNDEPAIDSILMVGAFLEGDKLGPTDTSYYQDIISTLTGSEFPVSKSLTAHLENGANGIPHDNETVTVHNVHEDHGGIDFLKTSAKASIVVLAAIPFYHDSYGKKTESFLADRFTAADAPNETIQDWRNAIDRTGAKIVCITGDPTCIGLEDIMTENDIAIKKASSGTDMQILIDKSLFEEPEIKHFMGTKEGQKLNAIATQAYLLEGSGFFQLETQAKRNPDTLTTDITQELKFDPYRTDSYNNQTAELA